MQSCYLFEYLCDHILYLNNCVQLFITCLNFVEPNDHTTKNIIKFIKTYVRFTPAEVILLAQNNNSAIRRDYTSCHLTRSFCNRRCQNERLWSRFSPQDFKSVYCHDEQTLYPNFVGAHSDIRLLLCCCFHAHCECHRQAVSRNDKGLDFQSMFDSERIIDVDADSIHSTFLRNEIIYRTL